MVSGLWTVDEAIHSRSLDKNTRREVVDMWINSWVRMDKRNKKVVWSCTSYDGWMRKYVERVWSISSCFQALKLLPHSLSTASVLMQTTSTSSTGTQSTNKQYTVLLFAVWFGWINFDLLLRGSEIGGKH